MKRLNFFCVSLCLVYVIFIGCLPESSKAERLAHTYCSSCHIFPEPSLLDKATWSQVLPQMAFRMGAGHFEMVERVPPGDMKTVMATIPSVAMVTPAQWSMIEDYYLTAAPDSLIITDRPVIKEMTGFDVSLNASFAAPYDTLIKTDPETKNIYVGTRLSYLYKLNQQLVITDSLKLTSTPSDIIFEKDQTWLTLMGWMDPNDQPIGSIVHADTKMATFHTLLDTLRRPVQLAKADLNGDGSDEFVVCAFGNFLGSLSLYDFSKTLPEQKILSLKPGSRKVVIKDFNKDGLPDILALMTQGDERLALFTNKGGLQFEEQNLLQFPSVYGSNYFELADFNGDGFEDILYVNGDNGDYSVIFKPYHGIRIFENDGTFHFKEKYNFFMAGASEAMARDFDGDGDLDIAAIAFFPDFKKHPEQSFIYLENKGGYDFEAQVTPEAVKGRWLVMESTDFDLDGDTDILVGAANFKGMGFNGGQPWREGEGSLLVFRNRLKH